MRFFIFIVMVGLCRANHFSTWDLVDMRRMLLDGEALQIPQALPEYLIHIDYTNITWEENYDEDEFGKVWYTRKQCKSCAKPIEEWVINNKDLFQTLIPYNNISKVSLVLTKYTAGDYLELHTDYDHKDRLLSFVLHLNWMQPSCGGEFVWAAEKGIKKAPVMKNVLYMFVPSKHSWHGIQQVHCGDRYAISGWFY